jgi:hypothetical protein
VETIKELTGHCDVLYDAHNRLRRIAEEPNFHPDEVRELGQRLEAIADELGEGCVGRSRQSCPSHRMTACS